MIINRKSIINLPSRNSVHRFGIQCESEFSAQIFLTEIGIQCWSEFRPSRNSVREPTGFKENRRVGLFFNMNM